MSLSAGFILKNILARLASSVTKTESGFFINSNFMLIAVGFHGVA
jgi:hypothetical protein